VDSPFSNIEHPSNLLDLDQSSRGESTPVFDSLLPSVLAASSSSRKYKLWVCPDDHQDLCYRVIGTGGVTFCILSKCSINHKGTQHFHPLPGEIYVMRNFSSVFVAPSISSSRITSELLATWLEDSCSVDEWNNRFLLLKQEIKNPILRLESEKISQSDIEAKNEFVTSALAFQPPRKSSTTFSNDDNENLLDFAPLSSEIDINDNVYTTLNDKFSKIVYFLETIQANHNRESMIMTAGFQSFDLKVSQLHDKLGSQPVLLDQKFSSPNLWLSLGLIADELSKIPSSEGLKRKEVIALIEEKFDNMNITSSLNRLVLPISSNVKSLNDFTVNAVRLLNTKISSLPTSTGSTSYIDDVKLEFKEREDRLWEKISDLERELASYRSSKDDSVIKFGQLGIRNPREMNSWMETNHPGENFGMLVDFHLVMEHIQVQITGQKLISNLEKIYKMSLDSNNQALAISSFETRVPRFFSSESKNYVRKDESYFSSIKTWDEWDLPHDGYRDRLNEELHLFKRGHQFLIDSELSAMTPFHTLRHLALTESVAWIEGLMKFLDDTYNEYSRSRFGSKKAWHITTRLAKALTDKVASPRNSVHNSFKINELHFVSKAITYACLRSLDIMMSISSCNFKNSPFITSELSKFLALNSNLEIVEAIQSKVKTMESENASIKKDVKSAANATHTASNKWDSTYKSIIDDLKKRVKSLESRN